MALTQGQLQRSRQWGVLLPAGTALILSLAGDLTLYAVLPAYATSLGLSLASLGVLLSANRLIRLGTNPLVGWLAKHVSRRALVLTGLATGTLSTLLYVLASGFWTFLIGRLLWGISWSLLYIGIYCIVLDITGPEERGWGSGILQTFYFIGLAINPVIGGFLSERLGFTHGLLVCAALQAAGLVGALVFLPETHPASGLWSALTRRRLVMPRVRVFDLLRELSPAKIFPKSEILSANYIYLLTLFIGDGIIMSTVTLYLKQRYGDMIGIGTLAVPVAAAGGILLALRAIVSACAAPLAGRWSDRRGMRWGVAGWGTLAAAAGCAFLAINGSIGLILVGISLASLGSGMLMAVLPAIVSSAAGGDQGGFAIGVLMTSGDFGCAIAPLIGYTLLGSISLSQQYLISAGFLITGGIVILAAIRQSVAFSKKIRPV